MAGRVQLGAFLDLVDEQSALQRAMHDHLADGFLALAREGYRDPASGVRLRNVAPACADSFVTKRGDLVMTAGADRSPLAPLPSAELRVAITAFRAALADAVRVVSARARLRGMDVIDFGTAPDAGKDDAKSADAAAAQTGDDDGVDDDGVDDDGEGEWQVVRKG